MYKLLENLNLKTINDIIKYIQSKYLKKTIKNKFFATNLKKGNHTQNQNTIPPDYRPEAPTKTTQTEEGIKACKTGDSRPPSSPHPS